MKTSFQFTSGSASGIWLNIFRVDREDSSLFSISEVEHQRNVKRLTITVWSICRDSDVTIRSVSSTSLLGRPTSLLVRPTL